MKLTALIDGSIYGESVCDHSIWVADKTNADINIMHVLGRREVGETNLSGSIGLGARTALLEELSELDEQKNRLAQKRGRALLETSASYISSKSSYSPEQKLRHGDITEALEVVEMRLI